MDQSSLDLRSVPEIFKEAGGEWNQFFIPAYQRGYRWKPAQVTQLLEDLLEFHTNPLAGDFYCLQPLVLKKSTQATDESEVAMRQTYRVIDGQQRLTTMFLILKALRELELWDVGSFSLDHFEEILEYETRKGSRDFLNKIEQEAETKRQREDPDEHHMAEAYKAAKRWLQHREEDAKLIAKLFSASRNSEGGTRTVCVIWYELSAGGDEYAAFQRLNAGKIQLKNEELIRALFLKKQHDVKAKDAALTREIELEWDCFETALQHDDFWYFLKANEGKGSRIGILFDLALENHPPKIKNFSKEGRFSTFYAYDNLFKQAEGKEDVRKEEWERVREVFYKLQEWFEDRELFHMVGYLLHQGVRVGKLIQEEQEQTPQSKSVFKFRLKSLILENLSKDIKTAEDLEIFIDECSYDRGKGNVNKVLLLFNIATLLMNKSSNVRFQFDAFKREKWDIEHIRPQSSKTEQEPTSKDALGDTSDMSWMDGIGNLTLLDRATNRGYKDAKFPIKRWWIIKNDEEGIFTPPCTYHVFMKRYTDKSSEFVENVEVIFNNEWSEHDATCYQGKLTKTLIDFHFPQLQA